MWRVSNVRKNNPKIHVQSQLPPCSGCHGTIRDLLVCPVWSAQKLRLGKTSALVQVPHRSISFAALGTALICQFVLSKNETLELCSSKKMLAFSIEHTRWNLSPAFCGRVECFVRLSKTISKPINICLIYLVYYSLGVCRIIFSVVITFAGFIQLWDYLQVNFKHLCDLPQILLERSQTTDIIHLI